MNRSLKRIFSTALFALAFSGACLAQQYPVFSQYYFNELVINPAYAGNHGQLSITTMYRNQWVNFPGAPKTFNLSGHSSFMKNKVGVGLMINRDEIGSYKNDHIYGYYSYMLRLSNDATLAMGLQAGMNILRADYSELDLTDPDDASFANIVNKIKPNFGGGLYYSRKNFFVGFSVPFILNNKVANSVEGLLGELKEARYYFLRAGTVFPITQNKNVKMNPSFLVRAQEKQPLTFDINNAFIFYDLFSLGVSYRLGDAFIGFIDLKLSDSIHFGYAYDATTSNLNKFSNGTHEFMLNYRVRIRKLHGNIECPSYYHYR
jgi:type IX secretion system PorP/SprF family membrane protein